MNQDRPVFLGPLKARWALFARREPARASAFVLLVALLAFFWLSSSGILPHLPGSGEEPIALNPIIAFVYFAIIAIGLFSLPGILLACILAFTSRQIILPAWYWRMLREHPLWSVIATVLAAEGIKVYISMFSSFS